VIYFQPNLAIDEAGRVGISAFALAHGLVNQVLLLSTPHQLRFRAPLQVTTTPFDPHSPTAGGKHGAWWIGDYQGITTSAGAFTSCGTTPAPESSTSSRPPSAHDAIRMLRGRPYRRERSMADCHGAWDCNFN
jgi:hypothetical protein